MNTGIVTMAIPAANVTYNPVDKNEYCIAHVIIVGVIPAKKIAAML